MGFLIFDTVKSQLPFPVTSVKGELPQQSCDWINVIIVRAEGSPLPKKHKEMVDLLGRLVLDGLSNETIA